MLSGISAMITASLVPSALFGGDVANGHTLLDFERDLGPGHLVGLHALAHRIHVHLTFPAMPSVTGTSVPLASIKRPT